MVIIHIQQAGPLPVPRSGCRLGQRRRCANMVGRSQQQRVTHGIRIPAEARFHTFLNSSVVLIVGISVIPYRRSTLAIHDRHT